MIGWLDDEKTGRIGEYDVLGATDWLETHSQSVVVFVGIGKSVLRRAVVARLGPLALQFGIIRHPSAQIARSSKVATGLYLGANAVVSDGVSIQPHTHINIGATVSHDCSLAEFVTLAPGVHLAGATSVGAAAEIGIGAVSIPGVRIGAGTIVGAGAAIVDDLPDYTTAVGVPARPIRSTSASSR
jgi:sugar O-acyltransferase (sialic acid O-acetyltransferase NeuD family)